MTAIDPSLLQGDNAPFLDDAYRAWLADPDAVDPAWAALFASWEPVDADGPPLDPGPRPITRSIFHGGGAATPDAMSAAGHRQAKVAQIINAYRVRGHMVANIDPLGRHHKVQHPELDLAYYDLTDADLDHPVLSTPLHHEPVVSTLRSILKRLHEAYCGSVGAEFMNILSLPEKAWVQRQLEALPHRTALSPEDERRVLRKLADAEYFERAIHTRFPGTKRFSLEGAEPVIPLLDSLVEHLAARGVREIVLGMAHRGRLNTLVNLLDKPVLQVIREFQDVKKGTTQGSGDVKYHLGYSSDRRTRGGEIVHLSLTPNPSHLEAVDPVVQGRVRAKQDRVGDAEHATVCPVLIHGDAAFAGQGLVMEVLNLSDLKGYRTGGTVHVVINNQIGFTTTAAEARSTPYATDVARMLAVPILHVNGEDPYAVEAAVRIAAEWRQTFHRDIVLDMYCYRKHGHNESDEPSFTQPQMYAAIRSRPTPREVYAQHLVDAGRLTADDVAAVDQASKDALEAALVEPEEGPRAHREALQTKPARDMGDLFHKDPHAAVDAYRKDVDVDSPLKGLWNRYVGQSIHEEADTSVDPEGLRALLIRANTAPDGFGVHAKVKRLLTQRREMIAGERGCDWSIGEQAAFATLLVGGHRVRLSGQDSGRGTFSHRHAVLTDPKTGDELFPLQRLADDQAPFQVVDSMLSEAGVLGFEWGYSLDMPDGLVIWEAQFGDFANGAQVIIDNFIAASETKWNRYSGLVMFLPHGYEGQGPEHSSARLERYLQLCAEENLQVANCTTPASLCHLLRRQVLRRVRKPLVIMTPKSLLRHPDATSTVEELATGGFRAVIDDDGVDPADVRRVVLCSGKVYYDLLAARREREQADVALVRVELLHPYPRDAIDTILARYGDVEVAWCQEEPRNMGAWSMYLHWMLDHFGATALPRYIGRPPAASPATGSHKKHHDQQHAIVDEALG